MKFRILTVLALLLAGFLSPRAVFAQENSSVLVRFYYSSWMDGKVDKSPLDPTGFFAADKTLAGNAKSELELIFFQHLGVSYSRQKLRRAFVDEFGNSAICAAPPCFVQESGDFKTINFTLYAFEAGGDSFNLFIGGGSGSGDYFLDLNGQPQAPREVFKDLSVTRAFSGLEYAFERIGFRIEFSKLRAEKSVGIETAEIEESRQHLIVFIPFN